MAKKKDHITQSKEYQRYLDDQMTPQERHAFEMRMLEDDFESEALEGFSNSSPDEIRADLSKLKSKLQRRAKNKSGFVYWRAAAAMLLLGLFSFIVYYLIDTNSKTENLQTRDLQNDRQREELQEPEIIIHDTIAEEEQPIVAYNKNLDQDVEQKRSAAPVESQVESGKLVEELIELDVAMEDEEMMLEEVFLEEMQPADLPTLDTEEKPETPDISVEKSISGRLAGVAIRDPQKTSKQLEIPYHTKTISGKIYSTEDDEVLPGVNVIVKGSTNGTISDVEGNYSINVPEDEEVTLVFSSVGYITEEVEIGEKSEVDVDFTADVAALSEIVVVGYGTESNEDPEYSFTPPRPEGGRNSFRDFVKENIRYPFSGLEEEIKGTVKLKFTVKTTGAIANLEVLKSLGDDFDKEAIRLVNEGPAWEPAELNGNTVEREVKVKIRFRVPE